MKKALMILSSLLVAIGAFAQGQVNFAPRVVGVYDAPVFVGTDLSATGTRASGPAYMAQLYAGASATGTLSPVGAALPFRTGAAAGYWTAEARTISTVDATGNAFVQVRAWATASGATYEAAAATGSGFGSSATLTIKPTVAPDVPANLTGLTSFAISGGVIPEPSVMAVAALGGLALLLRRRK
jgi:uncharacterized protein (TIGR03382 family)